MMFAPGSIRLHDLTPVSVPSGRCFANLTNQAGPRMNYNDKDDLFLLPLVNYLIISCQDLTKRFFLAIVRTLSAEEDDLM